jgi:hypothetical protein
VHNVTRVVVERSGNTALLVPRGCHGHAAADLCTVRRRIQCCTGATFVISWIAPQFSDNDQLHYLTFADISDGPQVVLTLSTQIVHTVPSPARSAVSWIFKTSVDASSSSGSTDMTQIVACASAGGALSLLILAVVVMQRNKRRKPHDFMDLLNMMDTPHGTENLKPRKIKRNNIKIVGKGNYGTVDNKN